MYFLLVNNLNTKSALFLTFIYIFISILVTTAFELTNSKNYQANWHGLFLPDFNEVFVQKFLWFRLF